MVAFAVFLAADRERPAGQAGPLGFACASCQGDISTTPNDFTPASSGRGACALFALDGGVGAGCLPARRPSVVKGRGHTPTP